MARQIETIRRAAQSEAEGVQRRAEAERADLKATISRLEVELMRVGPDEAVHKEPGVANRFRDIQADKNRTQGLENLQKQHEASLSNQGRLLEQAEARAAEAGSRLQRSEARCQELEERLRLADDEIQKVRDRPIVCSVAAPRLVR